MENKYHGMEPLLKVDNLSINFGGLKAVDNVNLKVYPGEIVGLIGPNGAGKTTVFNLLTGVYEPSEGSIIIDGKEMPRKIKPHEVVKLGLARTFQNIRLFKQLTVLENVMVAFNQEMKTNVFQSALRTRKFYKEEEYYKNKALEILSIFDLAVYASEQAQNLPYGKQRKLEIARAMATNPKVLLLDEPAAGMNPTETHELMEMIEYIRKNYEIAILLIEHDMSLVMNICEYITVLEYGAPIAAGSPEEIANNQRVIQAYLGSED